MNVDERPSIPLQTTAAGNKTSPEILGDVHPDTIYNILFPKEEVGGNLNNE